ncbi:protein of unknown function [Thauera humireducens]|nr:DUF1016 N-terminal domain-containing protein [Thauera humireducens]CAH1747341.1 protein of unknown function [Thauera humireducens]
MTNRPASLTPPPAGYADWLAELSTRIHSARQRAALAVNRELVSLYWQIGRDILQRQSRDGWGAKVIDRLAHELRTAFPDMKGLSPGNLKYMRAFAHAWPDAEFVQQAAARLPWFHRWPLAVQEQEQGGGRVRAGRQEPAHGHRRVQTAGIAACRVADGAAQHRADRARAGDTAQRGRWGTRLMGWELEDVEKPFVAQLQAGGWTDVEQDQSEEWD